MQQIGWLNQRYANQIKQTSPGLAYCRGEKYFCRDSGKTGKTMVLPFFPLSRQTNLDFYKSHKKCAVSGNDTDTSHKG